MGWLFGNDTMKGQNNQVFENMEEVCETIWQVLQMRATQPHPGHPLEGWGDPLER